MANKAMLAPKQVASESAVNVRSQQANSAGSSSGIGFDSTAIQQRGPQSTDHSPKMERNLISYIFPDFKAVEYFCKEFVSLGEFHILEKTQSCGFEIYLVDQWIRDRKIGSIASVFTGNSQSKVRVCKFTVVKRQSRDYPPRFQEYFNELLLNHATFKQMDNYSSANLEYSSSKNVSDIPTYLLVTNISAIPHDLLLVPVPGGDALAFEHKYMVNSNLKKLNCGGRSFSLIAEKISDASEDKFRQMYHIFNESVPIYFAILELVNLVQTCLFYYDLLDAKYADGLLCHKTEDAIENWWNLIGFPHFNYKPSHKSEVLSSRSVAAIISLTISVKLRMQLIGGCDVPKDLFDAEGFMISIGIFQKQFKLEKRRKLNLATLSRLFFYTNQGKSPEKFNSFYSSLGNESSLNEPESNTPYDRSFTNSFSPGKNGISSNNSLQGQTASVYRRNKIHYSKELKKLTNVVKNTVQDHIIVKEDADDLYPAPSPTKPTAKLKNKIVSRLSDTIEPADIETTNIEVFARKCIVGKTLSRLWVGLAQSESKIPFVPEENVDPAIPSINVTTEDNDVTSHRNSALYHHHHHHHHHRHSREGQDFFSWRRSRNDGGYEFISFRDSLSLNKDLNQNADKSGRLGRMKFTFQTRKPPSKDEFDNTQNSSLGVTLLKDKSYTSLLDIELQKLGRPSIPQYEAMVGDSEETNGEVFKNSMTLRRRSSVSAADDPNNLNSIIIKSQQKDDYYKKQSHVLNRATSFSALEEYFLKNDDMMTHERTRKDYFIQLSSIMSLESAKEYMTAETSKMARKAKSADMEARKIYNSHSSLLQRRSHFVTDYEDVLNYRMKDLADNLDKMAFRTRDLIKKIDELDEHINIFEAKESESMVRLDDMVKKIIHSSKFNTVFEDPVEKLDIVKTLSGAEALDDNYECDEKKVSGFRQFVVFVYQLLFTLLHLFRFDRSKMNLDRIRGQYKKLDPNRKYISKLYTFVGKESRGETTDDFHLEDTDKSS